MGILTIVKIVIAVLVVGGGCWIKHNYDQRIANEVLEEVSVQTEETKKEIKTERGQKVKTFKESVRGSAKRLKGKSGKDKAEEYKKRWTK